MRHKVGTRVVLRWIYTIFKYYPWNCIGFTAIRIIGFTGLGIVPGLIIKHFLNAVSNDTLTYNNMLLFVGVLVIVPLSQALSYYADMALSYGWVEAIRSIFRRNMFRYVVNQPAGVELPVPRGQLINTLRNDINTPIELVWDIPYFLAYSTFSVCGLLIMGSIDWMVTVVLLSPLMILLLIVNQMKKRIEGLFSEQQKAADRVTNLLADIFSYSFAIKNHQAQSHFLRRFQQLNDERTKKAIYNDTFDSFLNSIYSNMMNIGTGLLLLLISRKMYNGSFTIGEFSLFIYFLSYVSNLTRLLGKAFVGMKRTTVSYNRIAQVIPEETFANLTNKGDFSLTKDMKPALPTKPVERLVRLEVKDLSYEYPNSANGIRNISFALEKGSFTVVSGRVGSGKSTLLKVLLGLLPADHGEIRWNHETVDQPQSFFVPPRAAYVAQEPHLFSETLQDNILLGQNASPPRLAEAIRLAVLEEDVADLAHQLDTNIGTGGVKLSGGQRQRAAAARMFVRDAELWVFDDISSALDVKTEKEMWKRINEYVKAHQITCLVVSNKTYALQLADQVIHLDHGEIREEECGDTLVTA